MGHSKALSNLEGLGLNIIQLFKTAIIIQMVTNLTTVPLNKFSTLSWCKSNTFSRNVLQILNFDLLLG